MFHTKDYGKVYYKGLLRTPSSKGFINASPKRVVRGAPLLPKSVDLGSKGSPCEDQGQCGSCWDFALTKALRSAFMIAGKDPGVLAFNYLLNNCGPVKEYGCGGGDFDAGQNFLNGLGPWLESADPYGAQDGGRCKNLPPVATALRMVQVGSGTKPPTFEELAEAVAAGHYLAVDVDASGGSWANYSGGIYNHNGGSSIDHMINLVGYDMETSVDAQGNAAFNAHGQPINGDGFLIVRNNWGSSWGESGDMRTRWGMNAIAETAMYFEVEAPAPPTPPGPPTPPTPPVPPTPGTPLMLPWWATAIGAGAGFIAGFITGQAVKK